MSDLKKKLDALSGKSTDSPWWVNIDGAGGTFISGGSASAYVMEIGALEEDEKDADFVATLVNAWRNGALITREQAQTDVLAALDEAIDACQDRVGRLEEFSETECCAGAANNCAADVQAIRARYAEGK